MDRVTRYVYAYGEIENILKGKLDKLVTADRIEGLNICPEKGNKRKIIIPKLIGIYQKSDLKADSLSERAMLKRTKKGMSFLERLIDSIIDGDDNYQHLIHLGYSPDIWNKGLIRILLGGAARIALSPTKDLPDFYSKEYLRLEEYSKEIIENNEETELRKIAGNAVEEMEKQRMIYGLTKIEYHLLSTFHKLKELRREHKPIITDGPELETFIEKMKEKD